MAPSNCQALGHIPEQCQVSLTNPNATAGEEAAATKVHHEIHQRKPWIRRFKVRKADLP